MRAGGQRIHIGHTGGPILLPQMDELVQLHLVGNVGFSQVLHIRSRALVLPDLEVYFADVQEIPYFLHVEFEDGDLEFELQVLC